MQEENPEYVNDSNMNGKMPALVSFNVLESDQGLSVIGVVLPKHRWTQDGKSKKKKTKCKDRGSRPPAREYC